MLLDTVVRFIAKCIFCFCLRLPALAQSAPRPRSEAVWGQPTCHPASPEFQLKAHLAEERPLYPDHHRMKALVQSSEILDEMEKAIGSLE